MGVCMPCGDGDEPYYGVSEMLLPRYAWYEVNGEHRTWPIGVKEPNDWGLFDILGNVSEWCFNLQAQYPERADEIVIDAPSTQPVEDGVIRVMRGAAFDHRAAIVRSARRDETVPINRWGSIGFRPVRTYP
jgi:formylglycine-generating enzyme required for sulfatase activity